MSAPAAALLPASLAQEITWEQYLKAFLTEPTTTQPYEIIEGVRIFMNAPLLIHQIVQLNIAEQFRQYERRTGLVVTVVAPYDIVIRRIPKLQTRQPDVFLLSRSRVDQEGGPYREEPLEIAPELVVEILSPSETPRRLHSKLQDYLAIGIKECWIASTSGETVQVLREEAGEFIADAIYMYGQTVESRVFPDLRVALADIFAVWTLTTPTDTLAQSSTDESE
jgi:Uma2 family endonuclease